MAMCWPVSIAVGILPHKLFHLIASANQEQLLHLTSLVGLNHASIWPANDAIGDCVVPDEALKILPEGSGAARCGMHSLPP